MIYRLINRLLQIYLIKIEQEMNLMKKELSKNKIIITNTTMKEIINELKIIIVMNFFKERVLIKMIESEEI